MSAAVGRKLIALESTMERVMGRKGAGDVCVAGDLCSESDGLGGGEARRRGHGASLATRR